MKDADDSTIYSAKGTVAHDVAARCLTERSYPWEHLGRKVMHPKFGPIQVDDEIVRAVSIYVAFVRAMFDGAAAGGVEVRVQIPGLDMGDGGTVDAWALRVYPQAIILAIADYKNGTGVEVPLIEDSPLTLNPQLGSYGYGALTMVERMLGVTVDFVDLAVVQPNARSWKGEPKTARLARADLLAWVHQRAIPAAVASRDPASPRIPGPHCRETFCPLRGTCAPALAYAATQVINAASLPSAQPPRPTGAFVTPYED